jgi:hypothetical protein
MSDENDQRYAGPWGPVQRVVDEFVETYELCDGCGEGLDYSPDDQERYMIGDAIAGLLAEPNFISEMESLFADIARAKEVAEAQRMLDLTKP